MHWSTELMCHMNIYSDVIIPCVSVTTYLIYTFALYILSLFCKYLVLWVYKIHQLNWQCCINRLTFHWDGEEQSHHFLPMTTAPVHALSVSFLFLHIRTYKKKRLTKGFSNLCSNQIHFNTKINSTSRSLTFLMSDFNEYSQYFV